MKTQSAAPPRCRKQELITRVGRRYQNSAGKKLTTRELAAVIEAFLAEIQVSLAAGNSLVLKNHFSLEITTTPARLRANPRQPDQSIMVPALRKVSLRLSRS